jgi:nitrite reductase/ring-hydroxylating ferredoxin subunit
MTAASGDGDATEAESFRVAIDHHEYVIPRSCPHRGGYLQYGEINVQRKTITCPLHHSVFCLQTGAQLHGPPCGSLSIRSVAFASEGR